MDKIYVEVRRHSEGIDEYVYKGNYLLHGFGICDHRHTIAILENTETGKFSLEDIPNMRRIKSEVKSKMCTCEGPVDTYEVAPQIYACVTCGKEIK